MVKVLSMVKNGEGVGMVRHGEGTGYGESW